MPNGRLRRSAPGPTRRAWEVEGADRYYSLEVSRRAVSFGESGPPPTYGTGSSCRLRRFLAGEQHEWVTEFLGSDVLDEALSFARHLVENGEHLPPVESRASQVRELLRRIDHILGELDELDKKHQRAIAGDPDLYDRIERLQAEVARLREVLASYGAVAIPCLAEALRASRDPRTRAEAATVLGMTGSDEAVAPLLAALENEAPVVIVAVVQALGRLPLLDAGRRARSIEALEKAVRNPKYGANAFDSLSRLAPERALEGISAVKRRHWMLRVAMARAFASGPLAAFRRDPRARALLQALRRDRNPWVREVVREIRE